MEFRKVVITGLGMINSVGNDRDSCWEALKAGKNGIGPIERFDTEGFKVNFAGEIKNFDPQDCMDAKEARKADRFAQFAMAAAVQAMELDDVSAA